MSIKIVRSDVDLVRVGQCGEFDRLPCPIRDEVDDRATLLAVLDAEANEEDI